MMTAAIMSFLSGSALGLWFRAPIVFVTSLLILLATGANGFVHASSAWTIIFSVFANLAAFQMGYLAAQIGREFRRAPSRATSLAPAE
jgi:hypothetical protein